MSSNPSKMPALPTLKDLVFTKGDSDIAAKVKSFLPQIAKANEKLANIDPSLREALIMENIQELSSDSSSSSGSSDDDGDDSADESLYLKNEADHVEITVYKTKEPLPRSDDEDDEADSSTEKKEKTNDDDDEEFTIRLATSQPNK